MSSTRLPRKISLSIAGRPMLERVIHRVRLIPEVSKVVVATSYEEEDSWVLYRCQEWGIQALRGPLEDVLSRYQQVAKFLNLRATDHIVRITGDCPALDPAVSSQVIRLHLERRVDYTANIRDWPDGLDTEIFTRAALLDAHYLTSRPEDREHVTPFMRQRLFCAELPHEPNLRQVKFSVDTEEDLEYVRELYQALGDNFGWGEILRVDPRKVCELCAADVPHVERSLTSIGGSRDYTVWDLHAISRPGGEGIAECTAAMIHQRAVLIPRLTIATRLPADDSSARAQAGS